MPEYNTTIEELFSKYKLDFRILSDYIRATYDATAMRGIPLNVIKDSLSDGQTASKLWVVDELGKFLTIKEKSIGVFGGWVGLLCRFLVEMIGTPKIANIELDETLKLINNYVMLGHQDKFRFIHTDMYAFPYNDDQFDVYVNTSGEHIPSLKQWIEMIPVGKIVCIQSNNFFSHEQHINCVNNVEELEAQALSAANVKNVVYRGTMKLPIYNRFMIIALT